MRIKPRPNTNRGPESLGTTYWQKAGYSTPAEYHAAGGAGGSGPNRPRPGGSDWLNGTVPQPERPGFRPEMAQVLVDGVPTFTTINSGPSFVPMVGNYPTTKPLTSAEYQEALRIQAEQRQSTKPQSPLPNPNQSFSSVSPPGYRPQTQYETTNANQFQIIKEDINRRIRDGKLNVNEKKELAQELKRYEDGQRVRNQIIDRGSEQLPQLWGGGSTNENLYNRPIMRPGAQRWEDLSVAERNEVLRRRTPEYKDSQILQNAQNGLWKNESVMRLPGATGGGPSSSQRPSGAAGSQTKPQTTSMDDLQARANKGDRRAQMEIAKLKPADNFTGKSPYARTTPDEAWALEKAAASGDKKAKAEISLRLQTKDETGNHTLSMTRPALDRLHGKTDSPAIREAAELAKSGANPANKSIVLGKQHSAPSAATNKPSEFIPAGKPVPGKPGSVADGKGGWSYPNGSQPFIPAGSKIKGKPGAVADGKGGFSYPSGASPLDKIDSLTQARDILGNEIKTSDMLTGGGVNLQKHQRAEKKPDSGLKFRNVGGKIIIVGGSKPQTEINEDEQQTRKALMGDMKKGEKQAQKGMH